MLSLSARGQCNVTHILVVIRGDVMILPEKETLTHILSCWSWNEQTLPEQTVCMVTHILFHMEIS